MENLKLIEKHRKKTVFWHAFVKFISLYLIILTFLLTSIYFRSYSEDNALEFKVESVINILQNESFWNNPEEVLNRLWRNILEGVYIYNTSWDILSNLNVEALKTTIPNNKIVKINWYKYYSTEIEKENETYYIIADIVSNNFLKELLITLIVIIISMPFVYGFLYWISFIWLKKVYKPIEEMVISLEWFASDINHEFKTSLSEIVSSLELANITKKYENANNKAIWSAKKLNSMLDSLSFLIHFANSDYRKEKIDILKELDSSIVDFSNQIKEKKINIIKKYNSDKKIIKYIDRAALLLCFNNLFKNSIRYSKEKWDIEIYIEKNFFKIKDYWVWISKENLEKIFDRYFRESYVWQWSWIGLSLVKKITDIYNWEIKIDSKKNTFTEVIIFF